MTFDINALMNQSVDGEMATYLPPISEGEALARVGIGDDDVKVESVPGRKDPTKSYLKLTLMWDIIDDAYLALQGRDAARVRDQFFIDVDPATGMLSTDKEKNTALGQRRAALGMNSGSFALSMLRGAGPAMLRIAHRSDANDPERKYAEVRRVVAAG